MAASDRRQVQQELKQPDPFFEAIIESREYFEANRTKVLAVVGGTAAVLITIFAISSYYVSQSKTAATAFANAISSLESDSPSAAETETSSAGAYACA